MRKILIFIFLLSAFFISSEPVYDPYFFTRTTAEPVSWSPEEGIYSNTIYLSIAAEYGKAYYLVNNSLGEREPEAYKSEIVLEGKEGSITDYIVVIILEKDNGNIELYSRTYRIDKTINFTKSKYEPKKDFREQFKYEKNRIKVQYDFYSDNYNAAFGEREFVFPESVKQNESKTVNYEFAGRGKEKNIFHASLSVRKDNKVWSDIKSYKIDLNKPKPPSMGSLFWGQVYKQSYKIKIKSNLSQEKVYYWLREWKTRDLIVGPPSSENIDKWALYNEPVELKSEYGKNGIMGIAAFSMNESGVCSDITGPFYFRTDEADNKLEQVFDDEKVLEILKKKIFVNDIEYNGENTALPEQVKIKFQDFKSDDSFYFTIDSKRNNGRSDLFPCEGEYVFKNNDMENPLTLNFYSAAGQKLCEVILYGKEMFLPVMKKYGGNYIETSTDITLNFFMPLNPVKYAVSEEVNKFLIVNGGAKDFNGELKFEAKAGEERNYKLKFAAFDKNGNLIKESDEYFIKVDKKAAAFEVEGVGVNFSIVHNDKQILKLAAPEKKGKIYYRFSNDGEWILYTDQIAFYPPLYGRFSIKVWIKFEDDAGNATLNNEPFEMLFDTRAIFVDANKGFSGNGTEDSPCNSMERALDFARKKNIKLIYILSDFLNIYNPLKIETDAVIEPYDAGNIPEIFMDIKSAWRKTHMWFDVVPKKLLEMRNINFSINAGRYFTKTIDAKFKIYNSKIVYTGTDDFTLIKNESSKTGVNELFIEVMNNPINFQILESNNGYNILRNIKMNASLKDAFLFNIYENNYFSIDDFDADINSSGNLVFAKLYKADGLFNWLNIKLEGAFVKAKFFDIDNSSIYINESDFIQNGEKAFDTKTVSAKNSRVQSEKSLYWFKNGVSNTVFDLYNSTLLFERSLINSENVIDFSTNFRLVESNIKINSSVLRNINCGSSINFALDDSSFEGANNSVFNVDNKAKSFNFWVTDKAHLTTVNSIYYFSNIENPGSFIYFNNYNINAIKPLWFSNIISENVVILENMEAKDTENTIKDFNEKNIMFGFKNEFDFEKKEFFIPLNDSPILLGGMPEYTSPLSIPKKDFLGRNRIIQGFGIDVGAIQQSGNF